MVKIWTLGFEKKKNMIDIPVMKNVLKFQQEWLCHLICVNLLFVNLQ